MKNKIFLFLNVFILCVCVLTCSSYSASEVSFYDINDNLVTVPDVDPTVIDLSHGYIIKSDKYNHNIVALKEGSYFYCYFVEDGTVRIHVSGGWYFIELIDNSYVITEDHEEVSWHVSDYCDVIYQSADIYTDISKNHIEYKALPNFFLLTPLGRVVLVEGHKKVIPVEIVGILPIIIVIIVSLISLRKAWHLLLTVLNRS